MQAGSKSIDDWTFTIGARHRLIYYEHLPVDFDHPRLEIGFADRYRIESQVT